MNLYEYAKNELDILEKSCKSEESLKLQKAMDDSILNVIKVFADQNYSGSTASYALSTLKRLLTYKPLTSLTGEDSEWEDISQYQGKPGWQNKRCPSIFKEEDGKCFWVEGKYFSDDEGHTWYTCSESSIPVEFPFNVPDESDLIIIDNKKQRDLIYDKILLILKDKFNVNQFENINQETNISDILNVNDNENILKELAIYLEELFKINKVRIYSDDKLWNIINAIMNKIEVDEK